MKFTTKLLLGATVVAGLSISAFAACASDVDFGSTDGTNGKSITGLKNPVNAQDAATKSYVDTNTDKVQVINIPYSVDGNWTMPDAMRNKKIRIEMFSHGRAPFIMTGTSYYNPADNNAHAITSKVTLSSGMNATVVTRSGELNPLVQWSGIHGNTASWSAKLYIYDRF